MQLKVEKRSQMRGRWLRVCRREPWRSIEYVLDDCLKRIILIESFRTKDTIYTLESSRPALWHGYLCFRFLLGDITPIVCGVVCRAELVGHVCCLASSGGRVFAPNTYIGSHVKVLIGFDRE